MVSQYIKSIKLRNVLHEVSHDISFLVVEGSDITLGRSKRLRWVSQLRCGQWIVEWINVDIERYNLKLVIYFWLLKKRGLHRIFELPFLFFILKLLLPFVSLKSFALPSWLPDKIPSIVNLVNSHIPSNSSHFFHTLTLYSVVFL